VQASPNATVTFCRFAMLVVLCGVGARAAVAQTTFTDDAGRNVVLPAAVERVFAAGAPAEVLLYTLVPEKLAGRNHMPPEAALELMPPQHRAPRQIVNLPERDDPRYDTELRALDVDVYIDYGTIDDDYVGALEVISERAAIAGIILDGALEKVPTTYRKLGAGLGAAERGERLAQEAERLIDKYRGTLADPGVRIYLACSQNGLTPCVEGHSSGEVAALLGAINVGGKLGEAGRRALTVEEIRERAPDVVIASSKSAAASLRASPEWQTVPAVAAARVYAAPDLPFNWSRPPSVNRLPSLIWLAYVARGRPFDDEFRSDVTRFFAEFYHVTPTGAQLDKLFTD